MRHTAIPIIGDVPWGTHFCQFYEDKQDLIDILVPYFKAGLENNEFCMWVTSEPLGVEEAKAALASVVNDLEGRVRKGQIEFLDYSEWYTTGGKFESDRVLKGWVERLNSAVERGFDGLRLTGNTFWLEKADWQGFTEYEAAVDGVIGQYRMLAICTYSLATCGAVEIMDVVSNHAFALIKRAGKWQIIESAERKKIEASLRESEGQFQTLANAIPQLCWMANADGWIFWYNQRWYEYTGTTPQQMEGWGWQSVHDPEALPKVLERWKGSIASGQPFDMVFPLRGADGIFRSFLTRVMPVKGADGKVVRWFGTNTDVSEQKKTEEALRESEDRFRSLFEHAAVGIKQVDLDGRLIAANPALCRMLGYREGEILGKHSREFTHPDDREREQGQIDFLLRGRRDFINIELRYLDRNGKTIWVMLSSSVVKDLAGNPLYRISVIQDIDARKRAEEALRESERRFRVAQDLSPDGFLIFRPLRDGAGVVTDFLWIYENNAAARMNDTNPKEVCGKRVSDVLPHHDQSPFGKAYKEVAETGEVRVVEEALYEQDTFRQRRWFRVVAVPSGGDVAILVQNVTERKESEEALRVSEARLAAVMENLTEGLVIADTQGVVMHWNPAALAMFGYESMDECRRNLAEFAETFELRPVDEDRPLPVADWPMSRVLCGEILRDYAIRVRRPDQGWEKIVLYCGALVRSASGEGLAFLSTTDITARKRAEEAVQAERELLETVVEHTPAAVLLTEGPELTMRLVNSAYRQFAPDKPMAGKTLEEVWPEIGSETPNIFRHVLATGEPHNVTDQFFQIRRSPDGSLEPTYFSWSVHRVRLPGSGEWGLLNTAWETTQRRQIEQALRASEERLRLATEAAKIGTFDWNIQTGVNIWAPELEAMYGLAPGDFGRTQPAWEQLVYPDDRADAVAKVEETLATGEPVEHEWRVIWPDGSVHWIAGRFQGFKDASGEPLRLTGVNIDITARKRAENALAASESRLRALLESASQGVVAVDEHGRMILVNAKIEEMFGFSRGELLGQPLNILLPEGYRDVHAEHVRHYFANPRTRAMGLGLAIYGRTKDGSQFPLEISLSCIEEGGSRLAMALITDITERKKAEERLWQAQKLESIGVLAGGVAHDFNNLLVGVIGNASLAREMMDPVQDVVELLDGVIKTGEQLAHLTRQMLAYSGKGRFLVEALDISDLIPEMNSLVQPSIAKKIAVHLDLEPHLPLVEADRGQLQQIFMNLVINAAEAIGSNAGLITVKTAAAQIDEAYIRLHTEASDLHPGKYVTLEVRDTGCGMDEATKARIFDPFYSTKFTGRGLGLAAVAGIIRSHKGAVKVVSTPGKGSCFTVFFPAMQGKAVVQGSQTRRAALQGTGTILVVDDEKTVRVLAKRTLERYGYKVLLAYSGMAAIDMFKRHPGEISLVILDLSMPEMSGDEALPELRKLRPEVKVMVSSGYSESETMAFFRGQLVSGYVQKPYTTTVLAERVKAMLS